MMLIRALDANNPIEFDQVCEVSQTTVWGLGWTKDKLLSELNPPQLDCPRTHLSLAGFSSKSDLCGFILYRLSADNLEIIWLATHPQFLAQGVMQKLLAELFAAHSHLNEVWLEVHEKNQQALNLYIKMGFHKVGRRQAYYSDGGAAITLTKKLT
jgi:ribosomal protein S18 acetylase RimI-like enzyme